MYQNHTVSIQFVNTILEHSRAQDLPTNLLLGQAGISPNLMNNPRSRITPNQLSNFIKSLSLLLNDELMGLAERPMPIGSFALLAKNALHCDNLFEVYRDTQRALSVIQGPLQLNISQSKNLGTIEIIFNQLTTVSPILFDFILLIWHRFPSWLTQKVIQIDEIHMPFPKPEYSEEYPLLFSGDIQFNRLTMKLLIPIQEFELKCQRTLHELNDYLDQLPEIWFKRMNFQNRETRAVLQCLEQIDLVFDSSMDTIATIMNQSVRTLRRNLESENTNFKTLRAQFFRDKAVHLLTQERMKSHQVAEKLGYTEAAAFSRAFKQWTGSSPKDYRVIKS